MHVVSESVRAGVDFAAKFQYLLLNPCLVPVANDTMHYAFLPMPGIQLENLTLSCAVCNRDSTWSERQLMHGHAHC